MTLVSTVLGPLTGITLMLACAPAAEAAPSGPAHGNTEHPASTAASLSALRGDRDTAGEPSGTVRQSAATAGDGHRGVIDYWTPDRMAAALPLEYFLEGAASAAPPSGTDAPGAHSAPDATGERWTGGGAAAKTTGKVYLTLNGHDFSCSASVVEAANKDSVITAGHCLKDGAGPWVTNWMFIPGYDDGDTPYGRYTARHMLVPSRWAYQADDSFDFGMAVLNTVGGSHVQEETGAQGISFNGDPDGPVYAFGYPVADRFDGRRLYYCSGGTRPDTSGTTANGMACSMTEGSSGGPWLSGFDPGTGSGTITSVISFKYANDPHTQYGPRLGEEARRLYERAERL
ncbi:MAG: serine protease [Nocardiopsaceae bacterium]|nr:serine protease [Nocardiopsaceae bacterium]